MSCFWVEAYWQWIWDIEPEWAVRCPGGQSSGPDAQHDLSISAVRLPSDPVGLWASLAASVVPVGHRGCNHGPPCSASDLAPKIRARGLLRPGRCSLVGCASLRSPTASNSVYTPSAASTQVTVRGWSTGRVGGLRGLAAPACGGGGEGLSRARHVRTWTCADLPWSAIVSPAGFNWSDGVAQPWPSAPRARADATG